MAWVAACLASSSWLYSSCWSTVLIQELRKWASVVTSSPPGLGLINLALTQMDHLMPLFSINSLERWFKMEFVLQRRKRDMSCFWFLRGFSSSFFKDPSNAVVELQGLSFSSSTWFSGFSYPVWTSSRTFFVAGPLSSSSRFLFNKFPWQWTWCSTNLSRRWNAFLQLLQTCVIIPWCCFWWRFRSSFRVKDSSHWSHWNLFPPCIDRSWRLKLLNWVNVFEHVLQE